MLRLSMNKSSPASQGFFRTLWKTTKLYFIFYRFARKHSKVFSERNRQTGPPFCRPLPMLCPDEKRRRISLENAPAPLPTGTWPKSARKSKADPCTCINAQRPASFLLLLKHCVSCRHPAAPRCFADCLPDARASPAGQLRSRAREWHPQQPDECTATASAAHAS